MCIAYPAIEVAFVIKERGARAGSLFRLWNLPFRHWYSSNWDMPCNYFAHLELRIVQAESKMDSCSRHNGANWNSSRFVISLCGSARICYFSSQICSDLLFLGPLCPTVLFQPTWVKWWNTEVVVIQIQMWWQKKYRGGGNTNTNVVAVQIHGWWQNKYKCGGSTNTEVVAIQIQMWRQYKYRGGRDTNTRWWRYIYRGGGSTD